MSFFSGIALFLVCLLCGTSEGQTTISASTTSLLPTTVEDVTSSTTTTVPSPSSASSTLPETTSTSTLAADTTTTTATPDSTTTLLLTTSTGQEVTTTTAAPTTLLQTLLQTTVQDSTTPTSPIPTVATTVTVLPTFTTFESTSTVEALTSTSASVTVSTPAPETQVVVEVDCGTSLDTEETDTHVVTGIDQPLKFRNLGLPISGTDLPDVYKGHRWGIFAYNFGDLAEGRYKVKLGFAEMIQGFLCAEGARLFHVDINGLRVLENYDVFMTAGCRTAHDEEFDVDVDSSGLIRIAFFRVETHNSPMVSRIVLSRVLAEGETTAVPTTVIATSSASTASSTSASTATTTTLPEEITTLTVPVNVTSTATTTSATSAPIVVTNTSTTTMTDAVTSTTSTPIVVTNTSTTTMTDAVTSTTSTPTVATNATTTTMTDAVTNSTSSTGTSTVLPPTSTTTSVSSSTSGVLTVSVPAAETEIVVEVDCGTSLDTEETDTHVVTGINQPRKFRNLGLPISGTDLPDVYKGHRWGIFTYGFSDLVEGSYRVKLGFAEMIQGFLCAEGARLFHVEMNGLRVLENYDVFMTAGCRIAHDEEFDVDVDSSGVISIAFIGVPLKNNPMVSRIVLSRVLVEGETTPVPTTTLETTTTATLENITTISPTTNITTTSPTTNITTTVPVNVTSTIIPTNVTTTSPTINVTTTAIQSNTTTVAVTNVTSTTLPGAVDEVTVNAGVSEDETSNGFQCLEDCRVIQDFGATISGDNSGPEFQSARAGQKFSYSFNMIHNVYDITFGFAELSPLYCGNVSRVFSVTVNGIASETLTSLDVSRGAGGCQIGVVYTVRYEINGPLVMEFTSVSKDAMVSSIVIRKAAGCAVVVGTNSGEDHRAHAVAGTYPERINSNSPTSYNDLNGDGFEWVQIDGSGSHTHFQDLSDPANPVAASVVRYKWTNLETGDVMSDQIRFSYQFPMGTTRILLEVMDSTCSEAEAETSVTVTGATSPGAYCYYYQSVAPLTGVGLSGDPIKPEFASERKTAFSGNFQQPVGFLGSEGYTARCSFLYDVSADSEVTEMFVDAGNTGSAQVYRGSDLVLDTAVSSTANVSLAVGLTEFEVLYVRTSRSAPSVLSMNLNGTAVPLNKMSYDRSTVLPILQKVEPAESNVTGGVSLDVSGYGFYQKPIAYFGDVLVEVQNQGLSASAFKVITPVMPEGSVKLTVRSSPDGLSSNGLDFYFGSVADPVAFDKRKVLDQAGNIQKSNFATCIAIYGDSWYMGTLGGLVTKMEVDDEYKVASTCSTAPYRDPTMVANNGNVADFAILGIAFAPWDNIGKPYVAAQVLFYHRRNKISKSNKGAWRNGRVIQYRPGGGCMEYESTIISNLPVSDHDHGTNGMTFDQDGGMYLTVGGVTNGGLPHWKFGDIWETPLSSCIARVDLMKPGFNGTIEYSEMSVDNHRFTQKVSGDVQPYATGFRNSYDVVFTSQQAMYATDNGPNPSFGMHAAECDDVPENRTNDKFARDKIMQVFQGGYYGHPNLNRGECQYIDVDSDKDILGRDPMPSLNYIPELYTVKSSVNGIMEYTAAHFGGKLKGELITTNYASNGNGIIRRVNPNGGMRVMDFFYGGLTVAQGFYGALVFPRVDGRNEYNVMHPISSPAGFTLRVCTPFRGGIGGGLKLTLTGQGFGNSAVEVRIGGKVCALIPGSAKETQLGSIVKCISPAGDSGGLVDVSITLGSMSSVMTAGFMYTNI